MQSHVQNTRSSPAPSGTHLNVTAPVILKTGRGRLRQINVLNPGTAANLVINDAASFALAGTENQIANIPFGSLAFGQIITLDWPFMNGLLLTGVTTNGVFAFDVE